MLYKDDLNKLQSPLHLLQRVKPIVKQGIFALLN